MTINTECSTIAWCGHGGDKVGKKHINLIRGIKMALDLVEIGVVIAFILAGGALGGTATYFLPFLIAMKRKHQCVGQVFVLNLAIGWTFIGWCLVLAWAILGEAKEKADPFWVPKQNRYW